MLCVQNTIHNLYTDFEMDFYPIKNKFFGRTKHTQIREKDKTLNIIKLFCLSRFIYVDLYIILVISSLPFQFSAFYDNLQNLRSENLKINKMSVYSLKLLFCL